MAGTAALNALSVVSGIVTITGFIQSNLPSGPDPIGAAMKVAVGLDGDGLSDAGGDRPYVVGFNEVGDAIGLTENGDKIGSGSYAEMILDQNAAGTDATGQQPTYLQITPSGDDGICIAYISITWQDGLQRAWLGDMGEACNYAWFASNIIVGDDGRKTGCTWLDKDHTDDIWLGGFQFHTEDFVKLNDDYSTDAAHYCNYPAMLWKHEGDEFDGIGARSNTPRLWTPSNSTSTKRSFTPSKRSAGLEEQLVISKDASTPSHSAKKLCNSETSYGPDFVSIPEGLYCDMGSKELWALCDEKTATKCFDLESKTLIDGKRFAKRVYSRTHDWE